MAHITDIADQTSWDSHLEQGLIKRGENASGSVAVYNYVTAQVQFKKIWNPVTEASRGLIVNAATGEILARPFKKFFGWSEYSPEEQKSILQKDERVMVSDKLDGSLGILYTDPADGLEKIATRGSLEGHHARLATEMYREKYTGKWSPKEGYTYLFEILMPGAGVVISYPEETLVLIGRVNNETGRSSLLTEVEEWPWEKAEVLPYESMAEVLNAPARPYKEGVVVHFLGSDLRVKVKYDEFIRLHRIGSGVSKYRVWEALSNGVKMEEWKPFLEEEFYSFVDEVASDLSARYDAVLTEALEAQAAVREKFGEQFNRKEFAQHVNATYSKPIAQFILNSEFNSALEEKHRARLWDLVKPPKDI